MMDLSTVNAYSLAFQTAVYGHGVTMVDHQTDQRGDTFTYEVQSENNPRIYTVTLRKLRRNRYNNGGIHFDCDCEAGKSRRACYHQAGAHIANEIGILEPLKEGVTT